jgi:hypothetical protein
MGLTGSKANQNRDAMKTKQKLEDDHRGAVLLQVLRTPPKPHTEMKLGKPRSQRSKNSAKAAPGDASSKW